MNSEKYHVPELTADNFVDWLIKMKSILKAKELYQLVIGKEPSKVRGDDGKIFDVDQSLRLDKAHALIITRVHSSISGRVRKNGGDECPKKLWANILEFGSSKKQSNVFKAWYRLLHLPLRSNDVPGFISKFWDGVAVLQSLDVKVDEQVLGHIVLMKVPFELSHVRNAIIASGTTTETKVTFEYVLEMLDSQVKANTSAISITTPSKQPVASSDIENDSASALLTQKCPQGRHLPSASHNAENCFSLHPEKLSEYRRILKSKQEAEANLAMFESPTTYNVEAVQSSSATTINELVASFDKLPAHFSASVSDGHESEVSML
ncbi:uncharacterized protein VP01_265g9 [Puccinia sorghi]|uniref:DUF4219 domain-containing protein n=1 Tax=Puccinia sorghi TaxID=27349 RepID=A0A0L6V4R1_9BASI|nr:uncharacterized protein VP01_265g9 [Puccinia sorghi]